MDLLRAGSPVSRPTLMHRALELVSSESYCSRSQWQPIKGNAYSYSTSLLAFCHLLAYLQFVVPRVNGAHQLGKNCLTLNCIHRQGLYLLHLAAKNGQLGIDNNIEGAEYLRRFMQYRVVKVKGAR